MQGLRESSIARISNWLTVAVIIGFLIWLFGNFSNALRSALGAFLVDAALVVVVLRVTAFVQGASSARSRDSISEDPIELAANRRRLDPARRPLVAYLTIAVLLFAVPVVILLGSSSSEGLLRPAGVVRFLVIGAAIVAFATFVWVLLSGSLEQVLGPHGRPLSSRPTKRGGSATPLAQSRPRTAPGCQAEPRAGDALALIDCAALAYVLAERLSDALGRDFVVSATADNSLLVKHLEREQVITPRLGRFRLEPAATAIALTSQQMLSEVQWFVSETLNRPWPARPQLDDPGCLLQHSPARSRVAESGGFIYLSWQDREGTVTTLEPFPLEDVLLESPDV